MARPQADLPRAAAILALADDTRRISVRVTPGARQESLAIEGNRLLAKVRANPQDGEANKAVVALLAKGLGVATSRCRIVRGMT